MKQWKISRFLVIVSVIGTIIGSIAHRTDAQGSVTVTDLNSSVDVRRDDRGVPYITAANLPDAYFAQGYITASDRLWQMELLRRVARGESAEIFGKPRLEEDKRWRRFNFAGVAELNFAALAPASRSALESYAAGVNAFVATLSDKTLPVEFQVLGFRPAAWRPTDTIVIGKILAEALSTTWQQDILNASLQTLSPEKLADVRNRVTPDDVVLFGKDVPVRSKAASMRSSLEVDAATVAAAEADLELRRMSLERIGIYAEELAASNNWVISGKHTKSGKPILANDPHLQPAVPGIWYLTHISAPGMRVAGVTFPGVPGIVLGHNEWIAWGATNVGPDVQDVYLETFDDKGNYKTPDGWKPATQRLEKIKVRRDAASNATDTVEYTVVETEHGPIVLEDGGKRYALRWTALDPANNDLDAFFALNAAKDWRQFTAGLSTYRGAAQNFVYADVKGNIGWYAAGRIPTRRTGDGSLPYDGSTKQGDWTGSIPFAELPHLYNPRSGLIVTANQRTVGTDYKYNSFIRDAATPWRARRIFELLDRKRGIDFDLVAAVQHDTYNIPLKRLAEQIVRTSAASAQTLAALSSWNGRMEPESTGAFLVNEIRNCAARRIAEGNKPLPVGLIRERVLARAIEEKKNYWLPASVTSFDALLQACDSEVRTNLTVKHGADSNWKWSLASQSLFAHPLAAIPFIGAQFAVPKAAVPGSGQTANVGSYVSMRFIASPGLWDETRQVIPLGQSGDPRSRHFADQFPKWLSGEAAVLPFSETEIERRTVARMRLEPSGTK